MNRSRALDAAAILAVLGAALVCVACERPVTHSRVASIAAIERGRYLATAVADCMECHSPLHETDPPVAVAHLLGSGDILNQEKGLIAPNLTPDMETGAGSWTDEQFERAIRRGIGHDGRQLASSMPSNHFSALTDDDVASLIAYLRSLTPVRRAWPRSRPQPPIPQDIAPVAPWQADDLLQPSSRGEYLVRIARCINCHTPLGDDDRLDLARAFSGGKRFRLYKYWFVEAKPDPPLAAPDSGDPLGDTVVASANLTAHPSGLAHYDVDVFKRTLRSGKVNGVRPLSSAMPWVSYQYMTDDDLAAIFAYLRSLPQVAHRVSNQDPPTYCPLCRRRHGLGDTNAPFVPGQS